MDAVRSVDKVSDENGIVLHLATQTDRAVLSRTFDLLIEDGTCIADRDRTERYVGIFFSQQPRAVGSISPFVDDEFGWRG